MKLSSSWFCSPILPLLLANAAFASPPQIDFSSMGEVVITGNFAALQAFGTNNVTYDPTTSTLFLRSSDGSLTRLGSTNSGGKIVASCVLGSDIYFAGLFTSVNGTSASNVATYSTSSDIFSALGNGGPNGMVNALYCDSSSSEVWAGGSFSTPGGAVAIWNTKNSSWNSPPFGGLTGAGAEVSSISNNSSDKSLFFTGSFFTSFQGNSTIITINNTNNPNVPFSSGATPFSSSLVPIPLQGDQIVASPSSTQSGFSNINNILCPSGSDGPGNTWLAQDGSQATITVRAFAQLNAMGIRLGNTEQEGRGTLAFSVASIPQDQPLPLTYIDPTTGANLSCTDSCPLSDDPSIPYQDFLFSAPTSLTGFQLTLTQWIGAGAGLHLMQLLSDGAFVYAVPSLNNASCFAPNPSNVTLDGNWSEVDAVSNIAGTEAGILMASVNVGTPSSQAPSITFEPYVSASGDYVVSMLVPGCSGLQDCGFRTSVKVTTFPGANLPPTVTTIPQTNTDDVSLPVYSGPVLASSSSSVMTVTMELADQPLGTGQNGQYQIVAEKIELQLLSTSFNGTVNGTSGINSTSGVAAVQTGFGFFEWTLNAPEENAESPLSNSSETALDSVAIQFFNALGSSASAVANNDAINAVAFHPSAIILGGKFNLSQGQNIVLYKNGQLTSLPGDGLNGEVTSLVLDGDIVYIGGAFTNVASSSKNGVEGVVAYSITGNTYMPLQAGVNGQVNGLSLLDGELSVAGSFTLLNPNASDASLGTQVGGFAVWSTSNSSWTQSGGFVVGDMTFVGNSTSPSKGQQQQQFLAGNVAASLQFGAAGVAMLQNGASDGTPDIVALKNIQLEGPMQAAANQPSLRRRSHKRTLSAEAALAKRQSTTISSLPALPAIAPAVLTATFYSNASDEVMILGGNFTTANGLSQAVIFYDLTTGDVTGLAGNPLTGTVLSLLVSGTELYVGGNFTVQNSDVVGFAIVDLTSGQLSMSGLQPLQASSGPAVVRSLTTSPSQQNTVFVAGSFNTAGGSSCEGICMLDTNSKQWSQLGSGIQGQVASVAFAGTNEAILLASGAITLSGGVSSNVAAYSLSNSSWTSLGSLPGPVTALAVDNLNSSSVFAAGNNGQSAFLSYYNGENWNSLDSFDNSSIAQLAVLPLINTHEVNPIIESDRILMLLGSISSSSGIAASVLFDGVSATPYIMADTSNGSPGFASSVVSSITNFSFTQSHFLAVGIVILISIAISAGVVFLLALLGILWTLFARRDSVGKLDPADFDDDDDSTRHRPSSLLEHINAATRTTILGTGAASPFDEPRAKEDDAGATSTTHGHDPFANDGEYLRAETPSDAIAGIGFGPEEHSRPAHARYSFDGAGEGELPLNVGLELEVLDDRDHAWWYVRDVNSGQEGVVPAAYLY